MQTKAILAHSFGVMISINLIFTPFSHFNLFLVQAEVRKGEGESERKKEEEADERRQQGRILAIQRRMTEWAFAGQMIDENLKKLLLWKVINIMVKCIFRAVGGWIFYVILWIQF